MDPIRPNSLIQHFDGILDVLDEILDVLDIIDVLVAIDPLGKLLQVPLHIFIFTYFYEFFLCIFMYFYIDHKGIWQ